MRSKKNIIIIGSEGQDGRILCNKLKKKNNIIELNKKNFDITNSKLVYNIIKQKKPHKIFHLAAYHQSSEDVLKLNANLFNKSLQTNFLSLNYILETIKINNLNTKVFYASSSHIYKSSLKKQKEISIYNPTNYYGLTKSLAMQSCKYFRNNFSMFISTGILYNHESEFRKLNFISSKIINGAIDIYNNKKKYIFIGDLNKKVDWGYAYDYVDVMIKIMDYKKPDDFIISSGKLHTVREFTKIVFNYLGLDYKKYIKVDKNFHKEPSFHYGDNSKLLKLIKPKKFKDLEQMIHIIMKKKMKN